MRLLINITTKSLFVWDQLIQLCTEINQQRFAGLAVNLQLPRNQELSADQQAQLADMHVSAQERPTIVPGPDSYVLNLTETNHIFPGALAQWQSVTAEHPRTLVSLATFDDQLNIDEQIADYLTTHENNALLATYESLTDSEAVWPKLWGMQTYSIQTNLTNFRLFSQRLRPTGILLPADLLVSEFPLRSLAQNLNLLTQQTEVLRLHVPTIQNGLWSRDAPLSWFDQLQSGTQITLDPQWKVAFDRYYYAQMKKLSDPENHIELTESQRQKLQDQIDHVNLIDA